MRVSDRVGRTGPVIVVKNDVRDGEQGPRVGIKLPKSLGPQNKGFLRAIQTIAPGAKGAQEGGVEPVVRVRLSGLEAGGRTVAAGPGGVKPQEAAQGGSRFGVRPGGAVKKPEVSAVEQKSGVPQKKSGGAQQKSDVPPKGRVGASGKGGELGDSKRAACSTASAE